MIQQIRLKGIFNNNPSTPERNFDPEIQGKIKRWKKGKLT
jgi:hypothetical protein